MSTRNFPNETVFVSSRIDSLAGFRSRLADEYRNSDGFELWIYEEKTASPIQNPAIYLHNVARCALFVLLWEGPESRAVIDEVKLALEKGKPCEIFLKNGADSTTIKELLFKAGRDPKWRTWDTHDELFRLVKSAISDVISMCMKYMPFILQQMEQEYVAEAPPTVTTAVEGDGMSDIDTSQVIELFEGGQQASAEQFLLDKASRQPLAYRELLLLGCIQADLRKFEDAEQTFEIALAMDPDLPHAFFLIGSLFHATERPSQAVSRLVEAKNLGLKSPAVDVMLGMDSMRNGDFGGAYESFCDALRKQPRERIALSGRALALYNLGRFKEAKHALREVLRFFPDETISVLILAELHSKDGDMNEAEMYARKAIEARPEWQLPRLTLANILGGKGQFKESYEMFKAYLTPDPEFAELFSFYGVAAFRLGFFEEGVELHRMAESLDKRNPRILYNYACALAVAGYPLDALKKLEVAIRIDPDARELAQGDSDLQQVVPLLS
jgi:tetratricopeptide (TPR) repeat protein